MNVSPLLKKPKLQRYYLSQTLPIPCISDSDTLILNTGFYSMLQPEELLAVAAHEFNHIAKKHVKKRLPYTALPAAIGAVLVGGLLAINPFSIPVLSYLDSWLSIVGAALLSFVLLFFVSLHLNSKKLRQQETECDLSALDYGLGEAMKSALVKTNSITVQSKLQLKLNKIMPKIHRTTEQRIKENESALDKKPVYYKRQIDYVS